MTLSAQTTPVFGRPMPRNYLSADVTVETYADRDAWLMARRAHDVIGASEAAMVLGVSPYGTAWSLWESKTAPLEGARGKQLTRGHRWESAVLAEYADESGGQVVTPRDMFGAELVTLARRDLPWLRETPDAFAVDKLNGFGQVEAKTAMHAHAWAPEKGVVIDRWDDAYSEMLPAHYAVQGYVQLTVTGLPWVDLCALVPGGGWLGVRWVRLMRDDVTQDAMVNALGEWRELHLVRGDAPPLDGSEACNRQLAKQFPVGKLKPTRNATATEQALMTKLAALRAVAKQTKSDGDYLRNQLLESAEGHRLVMAADKGAPYGQPQVSKGKVLVNMDDLRAEAPELVAKHSRVGNPSASFNLYRFSEDEGDE